MSKVKPEDIEFTGGYNLLMLKAEEGNIEEVHRILTESKNVDINAGNKKGYTALALAIKSGNMDLVRLLLEVGADPNRKNNSGQTSLFLACWHNFEIVVRLLLDNGADINSVDHRGWTPLMISAYHGHRQIVKELLARKADTSAQDLFGKKAIDRAKDAEVIRLLTNTSARLASPQRKTKEQPSYYSPSFSSAQKSFNQPSSILKKSSSKVSIGQGQGKIEQMNQSLVSPQSTAAGISIHKSPSLNSTLRRSTEPRQTEPRRNSNQFKNNTLGNVTISTSNKQQQLQPQSADKSSTAMLKSTLNEIISPIKATTSIRISNSPSSGFERQLMKEDMEKLLMEQMGSMCHKIQQLVERKVALEIPMQMQTYEFQFKKEVESILKFKAADIFKNLQAIFNLKLKFCLTRLGYDTTGLGLAPFLEDEAPYVPESIQFAKEPVKLYNEKEYKAIENDIDRLEKSILNNKISPNSGREKFDCSPPNHQCDHTSQVHRTEMRNDLLDVLGQEVRASTEYLLEFSNGKVSDMTREESGSLFKKIMTEVTESMEVLEDELKFKFEEIITDKLNKITEALGSAAGNELPENRFKTIETKTPVQSAKPYNAFLNSSEDKLKARYLESTAAALKEDKYVSDFSQDPMRDSLYSEKKSNDARNRTQDTLQTKDRIQRIKNSLNFMDDADDYDPRSDKLHQQQRVVQRQVEERPEYDDEEEEEEIEEPPVPERVEEEVEIERAYDPTYRSSLTTETLYQTSSRDYKSVGSNRNATTNPSFRNAGKVNQQPAQSRSTHDAKNSAKKGHQIPGHKFHINNNNQRVEVDASSKYYNFANE